MFLEILDRFLEKDTRLFETPESKAASQVLRAGQRVIARCFYKPTTEEGTEAVDILISKPGQEEVYVEEGYILISEGNSFDVSNDTLRENLPRCADYLAP